MTIYRNILRIIISLIPNNLNNSTNPLLLAANTTPLPFNLSINNFLTF